jgi:cysteine-rich repeat protein
MNSLDAPDACRENCVFAFCGDETQDTGEECDLGPNPNTLCPYGDTSCFSCNGDCETINGNTQFCGDGELQAPEECDEGTDSTAGNSNQRADACRMTCIQYSCGDGFIDSGENCDDGNNNPADGCDTACLIEEGWECEGNPSTCTEIDFGIDGETCQNALVLSGSGGSVSGTYGETNELHPGAFGSPSCTDPYDLAGGYEMVYEILLAPGEGLLVTNAIANSTLVDMSIYLLDNCDPDVGSCLAGSDVVFEGDEEGFNFSGFGGASDPKTVFLIIDAWCSSDTSYCPTTTDIFNFNWSIISPI